MDTRACHQNLTHRLCSRLPCAHLLTTEQQAFAKYGLAYAVDEYLPAKLKEAEGQQFLGKK